MTSEILGDGVLSTREPPNVLIVDDQPANLLALEAILEGLPLRTVRATSGGEALRQLLKQTFALILLDVQMPGMDGFETTKAIKAHPRTAEIPIIFLTAISREATHVFKGYHLGAVDYILKPFDPHILKAKVTTFVDLFTKGETIKAQAKLLHDREMEALERRKEERYQRLADLVPLVMWATRVDGVVRYVNRAWREYSGLDVAETKAIDNPAFVYPGDLAEVSEKWSAALSSKRLFEMQFRLKRKIDGSYRWHLARAVPEHDENGIADGWVVTATDIDEQKHLEAARERFLEREQLARRTAETGNRMKDEFLANVSHELRTPLNAIVGWARMLRSGTLDPARVERALETIERNANIQTALIEDLLDVSRIVSGKLRLQRKRIEIFDFVQAAVETVRPTADAKGVTLELSSEPPIAEISGDAARLQQVIWNLVANAVKFTPKGGRVEVAARRFESVVEITVRDTGVGISPDFVGHVFDRFRQAEVRGSASHEGLGLGLAIARHIVELHGGRIEVESKGLGEGSVFRVALPVRLLNANDAEPAWFGGLNEADAVRALSSLEGLDVLFVDDEGDARELFTTLFTECGAKVTAVGSAAEALATLQSTSPHVLISDLVLPDEDGYSFIRRVRALGGGQNQRIPAIAVSGLVRAEERQRALTAGFQACLAKPIQPSELANLVRSLAQAARD